jgi:transcriptional regulator with XRE-family HTH domain
MGQTLSISTRELWMELKDRQLLRELLETNHISARQLAEDVGWKSHTFLQRLLRGEVKNLDPTKALLIAHRLNVPSHLLFVPRVSGDPVHSVRKQVA